MSHQGILTTSTTNAQVAALVQTVRGFMRDHPSLNRLIDGEETGDRLIAWALADTLDDINNTPPLIGTFALETFPYPHLLIRGTVISVLESVGLLQTRNQLSYSDGGIQFSVSEKTPLIQAWVNLFQQRYEQKKREWKIARNIDGAFGGEGVHSEYWYVSGFYGDF